MINLLGSYLCNIFLNKGREVDVIVLEANLCFKKRIDIPNFIYILQNSIIYLLGVHGLQITDD